MKICAVALVVLAASALAHADTRGLKVVGVRTPDGQELALYERSHALLIGVSDYTAGWPKLPSIPDEINGVERALSENGFTVTKVLDPDHAQLERAFREFIREYGYDPETRLLFYFAGHGWSRRGGEQGYLVPVNAPDPTKDERGFLRKALTMTQILAWCKELESRHALFLFDSCFSGTIFTTRALPERPPHITPLIAKPVRQFITAGDAGEEVPSRSVFTPLFIRAIQGEADMTGDGYVTGTELGLFLRDKVMYYQTGQTPQYGTIRDPGLDRGDFVFCPGDTGPGTASALDALASGIKWLRTPQGKCQLFVDGEPLHGRERLYLISDAAHTTHALLYDKPTRRYFLCKDFYKGAGDTSPQPGIILESPMGVLWSRERQKTFSLFVDGEPLHKQGTNRLVSTAADPDGRDLLIFDKTKRRYFLCKDFYKGAGDTSPQPGTSLESPTGAIWSRTPQGAYLLFVDGIPLHNEWQTRLVSKRFGADNRDHLIFDKTSRRYFLLSGFYTGAGDNGPQKGTVIESPTGAIWSRTPQGSYLLFVDGLPLHNEWKSRLLSQRTGSNEQDHLIFDKTSRRYFLCPGYYTGAGDAVPQSAIIPDSPTGVLWSRTPQGKYVLIVEGVPLHNEWKTRLVSQRVGSNAQDLRIYDKTTQRYYLCPGFYTGAGDSTLQRGIILESSAGKPIGR